MDFDSPLDEIFLNRSHVRVLRALFRLPEGFSASGRETARRAGVSHPTALRTLDALLDTGLVKASRSTTGNLYELNRSHVFAAGIADLYRTESSIGHDLAVFIRDQLLTLTTKVEWATLFGSVVRGDSTGVSDIDLAVSCAPTDADAVEGALDDLSDLIWQQFGNHLNPVINARKVRPKTGIWKRLESDGLALIRSGKAVEL